VTQEKVSYHRHQEIAEMKHLLNRNKFSSGLKIERKESEALERRIKNLQERMKLAEEEKEDLNRKLKEAAADKKEAEARLSRLEKKLKSTEEAKKKTNFEAGRKLAPSVESSKINEFAEEVRLFQHDKASLVGEIVTEDGRIESKSEEVLQKSIRIAELEKEVSNLNEKLEKVDVDKRRSQVSKSHEPFLLLSFCQ
jgi:predicted  nucleic acid-binding Zn-ribbon protein